MAKGLLPDPDLLHAALVRARWVISDAARELGVSRQAIYLAMERYGIRRRPQSYSVWREMRARRPAAKASKAS